ncbi:MAG: methyltransferase domain-containing protein, partial [Holosporales bacterium]|nr:methyltransferase domain-containing protein [Holosporales bacterium]
MHPSAQEWSRFYTLFGHNFVAEMRPLLEVWVSDLTSSQRIVGMGYPLPYCAIFGSYTQSLWIMPAAQGAEPGAFLVDETQLPFADSSIDALFLIHLLEFSSPKEVLKEADRVLAPEGSLLAFVPHKHGLRSRYLPPLGQGRAFSQAEMRVLFQEAGLSVDRCTPVLFPPTFLSERFARNPIPSKILS